MITGRDSGKEIPRKAFYTAAEVAVILGREHKTIVKWARAGQIPASKFNNRWRFSRIEIDEILDSALDD